MTTITGKLVDAAGNAVRGQTVRGVLVAATEVLSDAGGQIIRDTSTVSAADGTWSLTLTPTSGLVEDGGAYYLIMADGHRWTIDVPDSGTHDIGDDGILTVPGPLDPLGATAAQLAAHAALTEDAHGIVDTANLVTAAAVIADDSYVRGAGGARGVEGRTPAQVAADIGALVTFARTVLAPEPGKRWFLGSDPFDAGLLAIVAVGDRFTYVEGHAQEGETYRWSGSTWVLTQTLAALPASVVASLLGVAITTDQTINADLEIADPGVKGYRFRRSGSGLDLDGTGADLFLSVFSGTDYDGTQRTYIRFESGAQLGHLVGPWVVAATPFGGTVLEATPSETPGAGELGFFGAEPVVQQSITGATDADKITSLIAAGVALGLWTDDTT